MRGGGETLLFVYYAVVLNFSIVPDYRICYYSVQCAYACPINESGSERIP